MLRISARIRRLHAPALQAVQCCLELFPRPWKLSSITWLVRRDIEAKEKRSEIMQIGIKAHVQASRDLDFKLFFRVIKSTYSETL